MINYVIMFDFDLNILGLFEFSFIFIKKFFKNIWNWAPVPGLDHQCFYFTPRPSPLLFHFFPWVWLSSQFSLISLSHRVTGTASQPCSASFSHQTFHIAYFLSWVCFFFCLFVQCLWNNMFIFANLYWANIASYYHQYKLSPVTH